MILLILGIGNCPEGGNDRFWFGILPWLILFFAVSAWSSRAHRHYVRLYTREHGRASLLSDDYQAGGGARQYMLTGRGFRINRRLRRIVWERQQEPELEKARHVVVRRWRTLWVVLGAMALFAPVIPGILIPC